MSRTVARTAMADPVKKTFDVLASTDNLNAVEVLISALDSTDEKIRTAAVAALLQRRTTRGQVEVIRRLDSLTPEACSHLENEASKISTSLKQCLLHGDNELRHNGLEVVRLTEDYRQVPALLEMLRDDRHQLHGLTAEVLRALAHRLYEHCHRAKKDTEASGKYLRNAQRVRQDVLAALDRACAEFEGLAHAQDVVESILILGDPNHFAVNRVLSQAGFDCRKLAGDLLDSSMHPGIMQLILDSMSKNYPPPKVLEVIRTRKDAEFICYLLRRFPKRLSHMQMRNFRRIESVAWIGPDGATSAAIPSELQTSLVSFVSATGLPSGQKATLQEWLIRHGSREGRLAASDVLATLDEQSIQEIVFDGLSSEDAEVQAWSTSQLRKQKIPETFSLLIERLDSPMNAVRDAARAELASFNLERMMGLFEHLDPEVCVRAGRLLEKINPDSIEQLSGELSNPIRRKRIQAARAARAMGLHVRVVPSILVMLEDDDPLVRRAGITLLADIPTMEAVEALQQVIEEDLSRRVREAAVASLEQIWQKAAAGHFTLAATHDG